MIKNKPIVEISEVVLQAIESISEALVGLVQKYRELRLSNQVPTVTAFGLLKAGKSTFLNALTDDLENCRFAHGVVRTTVKNQMFFYNGINILDTPGIDANNQDTSVALHGLNSTDIFLFIHNPKNGELDQQEVELIQSLFNFYPSPAIVIENMICILTHKASLNDADQDIIQLRIQKQFNDYFGDSPKICLVESPSYFKARKENKQILLQKSGIDSVWDLIINLLPNVANAKIAKENEMIKKIKINLQNEKLKIEKELEKAEKTMTSINEEVNVLRTKIKQF